MTPLTRKELPMMRSVPSGKAESILFIFLKCDTESPGNVIEFPAETLSEDTHPIRTQNCIKHLNVNSTTWG